MGFDFIVIAPLLPSHCGFSFVFGCEVSFLVSFNVFLSMTVQKIVVILVLSRFHFLMENCQHCIVRRGSGIGLFLQKYLENVICYIYHCISNFCYSFLADFAKYLHLQILFFILKYSWFTMLCQSLLYRSSCLEIHRFTFYICTAVLLAIYGVFWAILLPFTLYSK